MEALHQAQISFFMTGKGLDSVRGLNLVPAAMAPYRRLEELRHDFPVVLCAGGAPRSLSSIVDSLGLENDASRHFAIQVERELRHAAACGTRGMFLDLWDRAAGRVKSKSDGSSPEIAARLRKALQTDGEIVDCDKAFPAQFLQHAFRRAQTDKAKRLRAEINRLILKLEDILRADDLNTQVGRSPEALMAAVGTAHASQFDFETMSGLLDGSIPEATLASSRRNRIERLLETFRRQRFVTLDDHPRTNGSMPYGFEFDSCAEAMEAYLQRQPAAAELSKALTMATLEANGEYVESRHDTIFESMSSTPDVSDLDRFPAYFVRLRTSKASAPEMARSVSCLSAGFPFKFLLQTDDLWEGFGQSSPSPTPALRNLELCQTAIALGGVFVLQTGSAGLYRLRDRVHRGMALEGPALFGIYSGAGGGHLAIGPYLASAAAAESRVFPSFVYDPSGKDLAGRLSIDSNPFADRSWPPHKVRYEDGALQKQVQDVEFTALDFLACDNRWANHFSAIPSEETGEHLVPYSALPELAAGELPDRLPFLLCVDDDGGLHRVLADEGAVHATRRIADRWRSLQELGGIGNSHAERLLAEKDKEWEARLAEMEQRLLDAPPPPLQSVSEVASLLSPTVAADTVDPAEPAEDKPSDEPWIETARCTTCNECTGINNKMFAYNENKQAYIADPLAGTYAQLVEAAESCQVSIIHPGKPKNPKEPGLDDLLERATPFM